MHVSTWRRANSKIAMKKYSVFLLAVMGVLALASCNLPNPSSPTPVGPDSLRTVAVKTLEAMSTQLFQQSTATIPGSTPIPGNPTLTSQPSAAPSGTSAPAQTSTPGADCEQAAFIGDTTIPDNTVLLPGTAFTKTWEIKNTGSCNWDSNYSLVFANQGDLMNGPLSTPVVSTGSVTAGQTINISVNLVAPQLAKSYKGYWKLRDPNGNVFFGANQSIWVMIKVVTIDQKLALIDDMCSAQWRTAAGQDGSLLACPGKEGDSNGYVLRTDSPVFYNRGDNEPTFILGPQNVDNGMIVGTFPPLLIPAGAEFRSFAGCGQKMDSCDATVTITAQAGDAAEQTLKQWEQKADDFNAITIDLDAAGLGGKNVVFRIYVKAIGAAAQDKVLLLSPIIEQKP